MFALFLLLCAAVPSGGQLFFSNSERAASTRSAYARAASEAVNVRQESFVWRGAWRDAAGATRALSSEAREWIAFLRVYPSRDHFVEFVRVFGTSWVQSGSFGGYVESNLFFKEAVEQSSVANSNAVEFQSKVLEENSLQSTETTSEIQKAFSQSSQQSSRSEVGWCTCTDTNACNPANNDFTTVPSLIERALRPIHELVPADLVDPISRATLSVMFCNGAGDYVEDQNRCDCYLDSPECDCVKSRLDPEVERLRNLQSDLKKLKEACLAPLASHISSEVAGLPDDLPPPCSQAWDFPGSRWNKDTCRTFRVAKNDLYTYMTSTIKKNEQSVSHTLLNDPTELYNAFVDDAEQSPVPGLETEPTMSCFEFIEQEGGDRILSNIRRSQAILNDMMDSCRATIANSGVSLNPFESIDTNETDFTNSLLTTLRNAILQKFADSDNCVVTGCSSGSICTDNFSCAKLPPAVVPEPPAAATCDRSFIRMCTGAHKEAECQPLNDGSGVGCVMKPEFAQTAFVNHYYTQRSLFTSKSEFLLPGNTRINDAKGATCQPGQTVMQLPHGQFVCDCGFGADGYLQRPFINIFADSVVHNATCAAPCSTLSEAEIELLDDATIALAEPHFDAVCKDRVPRVNTCGNGVIEAGEICDPGTSFARFGENWLWPRTRLDPNCASNCKSCSSGALLYTWDAEKQETIALPLQGCAAPNKCGNGRKDSDEACDGDFCNSDCKSCQTGYAPGVDIVTGNPHGCVRSCGNGNLDEGEQCDPPGFSGCDRNCECISPGYISHQLAGKNDDKMGCTPIKNGTAIENDPSYSSFPMPETIERPLSVTPKAGIPGWALVPAECTAGSPGCDSGTLLCLTGFKPVGDQCEPMCGNNVVDVQLRVGSAADVNTRCQLFAAAHGGATTGACDSRTAPCTIDASTLVSAPSGTVVCLLPGVYRLENDLPFANNVTVSTADRSASGKPATIGTFVETCDSASDESCGKPCAAGQVCSQTPCDCLNGFQYDAAQSKCVAIRVVSDAERRNPLAECGNGVTQQGEACDGGECCTSDCRLIAGCESRNPLSQLRGVIKELESIVDLSEMNPIAIDGDQIKGLDIIDLDMRTAQDSNVYIVRSGVRYRVLFGNQLDLKGKWDAGRGTFEAVPGSGITDVEAPTQAPMTAPMMPTPAPSNTSLPNDNMSADVVSETGTPFWVWIIVAVGGVLLIAALIGVVVIVMRKRKDEESVNDNMTPMSATMTSNGDTATVYSSSNNTVDGEQAMNQFLVESKSRRSRRSGRSTRRGGASRRRSGRSRRSASRRAPSSGPPGSVPPRTGYAPPPNLTTNNEYASIPLSVAGSDTNYTGYETAPPVQNGPPQTNNTSGARLPPPIAQGGYPAGGGAMYIAIAVIALLSGAIAQSLTTETVTPKDIVIIIPADSSLSQLSVQMGQNSQIYGLFNSVSKRPVRTFEATIDRDCAVNNGGCTQECEIADMTKPTTSGVCRCRDDYQRVFGDLYESQCELKPLADLRAVGDISRLAQAWPNLDTFRYGIDVTTGDRKQMSNVPLFDWTFVEAATQSYVTSGVGQDQLSYYYPDQLTVSSTGAQCERQTSKVTFTIEEGLSTSSTDLETNSFQTEDEVVAVHDGRSCSEDNGGCAGRCVQIGNTDRITCLCSKGSSLSVDRSTCVVDGTLDCNLPSNAGCELECEFSDSPVIAGAVEGACACPENFRPMADNQFVCELVTACNDRWGGNSSDPNFGVLPCEGHKCIPTDDSFYCECVSDRDVCGGSGGCYRGCFRDQRCCQFVYEIELPVGSPTSHGYLPGLIKAGKLFEEVYGFNVWNFGNNRGLVYPEGFSYDMGRGCQVVKSSTSSSLYSSSDVQRSMSVTESLDASVSVGLPSKAPSTPDVTMKTKAGDVTTKTFAPGTPSKSRGGLALGYGHMSSRMNAEAFSSSISMNSVIMKTETIDSKFKVVNPEVPLFPSTPPAILTGDFQEAILRLTALIKTSGVNTMTFDGDNGDVRTAVFAFISRWGYYWIPEGYIGGKRWTTASVTQDSFAVRAERSAAQSTSNCGEFGVDDLQVKKATVDASVEYCHSRDDSASSSTSSGGSNFVEASESGGLGKVCCGNSDCYPGGMVVVEPVLTLPMSTFFTTANQVHAVVLGGIHSSRYCNGAGVIHNFGSTIDPSLHIESPQTDDSLETRALGTRICLCDDNSDCMSMLRPGPVVTSRAPSFFVVKWSPTQLLIGRDIVDYRVKLWSKGDLANEESEEGEALLSELPGTIGSLDVSHTKFDALASAEDENGRIGLLFDGAIGATSYRVTVTAIAATYDQDRAREGNDFTYPDTEGETEARVPAVCHFPTTGDRDTLADNFKKTAVYNIFSRHDTMMSKWVSGETLAAVRQYVALPEFLKVFESFSVNLRRIYTDDPFDPKFSGFDKTEGGSWWVSRWNQLADSAQRRCGNFPTPLTSNSIAEAYDEIPKKYNCDYRDIVSFKYASYVECKEQ